DPLWLSTLESIERDLVSDSLVHRYDPLHSPDVAALKEIDIAVNFMIDAAKEGPEEGQRES
ncbi:hypothetical protein ABT059_28240, partial [Micromonospora tulbaghiae]|uniref:hypothetical protein n=1 Tax=Micromonospora tulbaghiae TaxID=479978 RepID=UPI00332D1A1A